MANLERLIMLWTSDRMMAAALPPFSLQTNSQFFAVDRQGAGF